jgi:GTPase SAR1 family protein
MADTSSDPSNPKVTVVGDGNTGKTSMMVRFVENRFPEEHEHTQ